MKKSFIVKALLLSVLCFINLFGDEIDKFSINDALNSKFGQKYLNKNIALEFGSGYAGEIFKGESFKKTTSRSFADDEISRYDILTGEVKTISKEDGKSSLEKGCQYVFISALRVAQKKALKKGYDKIVNITTYFKNNKLDSKDEFICGHKTLKNVGIAYDYAK